MTNKNTRRALLASVMALLLCFSSLLGTTYAWFTDSVTSANNVIKAGNLDVTLEYWNGSAWKDVQDSSDIITGDLWEPGYTEVAYLRIKNAGSLALKYRFGVNITEEVPGINAVGDDFLLSDYIYYDVFEGVNGETAPFADRAAAMKDTTETSLISAGYSKAGTLVAGSDYVYLAMVVYMPTTVGNVANHNGKDVPEISLGLTAIATQFTDEEDSFDDQYDLASPWTGIIPATLADTTLEIVPGGGTQTGTITINSPEDLVYLNKLAAEWVSLYSNGQGTDVTQYRESNGGKGTDYYYHWQWEVKLAADLDMSDVPMDSVNISYWGTFDANGHTISNVVLKNGQDGLFNNGAKTIKNLTVKNIIVNAPKAETVGAVAGNGTLNNVHVENATVVGSKYVGGLIGKGSSLVDCSIKNSTVTAMNKTVGGLAGYSIGDPNKVTVSGNTVDNVTVTGTYNVGGLLGQAQNVTVENNTVKNSTVKSTLELPDGASSNEVRTAEVAARSAFDTTTIGTNTVENVTVIEVAAVSNNSGLSDALSATDPVVEVALGAGNYSLPGTANKDVTINGTKDTVVTIKTPNYSGSDVTFNGVTIQGSGYNTGVQHVNTVTYNDAIINGTMLLYGEKVVFNDCTFNLNGDYIWTYGAEEVEFNNCTFNTTGKAILIYKDGGIITTKVTVKGCTFNATAPAYASAITNQSCAAIEIQNYMSSITLITEDNTVDADFSGEWRIKQYDTANNCTVTVNGTAYTQTALDGKLLTVVNKEVQ